MSHSRLFIVVTLVAFSASLAQAQGRSGRDREVPARKGATPSTEHLLEARAEQAVQQSQRRAVDEAHRSLEHRAAAAEMAARASARRSARESSTDADLRRFARSRGVNPELVVERAMTHADVHAAIAAGRLSGRPMQLNDAQRAQLQEVFGDANLLDPREGDRPGQSNQQSRRESVSGDADNHPASLAPGARANANARLANAIRVRRAQISELRDRSIESGDEKLLARADQLEKTLEIFLANQARVEANLAEVGLRTRSRDSEGVAIETPVSDPVIRTAQRDSDNGLIESE